MVITAPVRSSAFADGGRDRVGGVADRRPPHDLHTVRRELAGEVRGVGVDREAEQQLVADRDDFDVHGADGVGGPRPRASAPAANGRAGEHAAVAAQVERERIERERDGADHRQNADRCR